MLDYLVTSDTRRSLLILLWREGVADNARGLAHRGHLSYAPVVQELARMVQARLAVIERPGGPAVYRANLDFLHAHLLRELLSLPSAAAEVHPAAEGKPLHGWLRTLGAPLSQPASAESIPCAEEVIALGFELAHKDSTVARALPVLLWKQHRALDFVRLEREAKRLGMKQTLGFYLALTGTLARSRRLKELSAALVDKRCKKPRAFFTHATSSRAQALAEHGTSTVARAWHFRMNMPMSNFESLFRKFAGSHESDLRPQ